MTIISLCAVKLAILTLLQPGPQTSLVETAAADLREDVFETQEFVGTVLPWKRTVVGSAVDGRVEEFKFDDGDWVAEGWPLAELLKTTIGLEVAAAKAEQDLREQELAELENGSRPEEIAQAAAGYERARAVATYADARLERVKSLHERGGSTSLEELQEAVSAAAAARETLAEAKATYDLVYEGPRKEKKLQAQARLDLAKANLERLEDMYNKYTVRAPFDGYITAENTEVGAWLSRGDPVVEMIAIDKVEITVSVPEEFITFQNLGAKVEVRFDALPGKKLTAEMARIIPQADLRSRSFPVKILLKNEVIEAPPPVVTEPSAAPSEGRAAEPDSAPPSEHDTAPEPTRTPPAGYLVKAGMLARVTLRVSEVEDALMVPKDAVVLQEGRRPMVFVVRKDPATGSHIAQPVEVDLGIELDSDIEVIGDLRNGEKVVTEGNERLSKRPPYSAVMVKKASQEENPSAARTR